MGAFWNAGGFFVRNKPVFTLGLGALIIAALADLVAGLFLANMEDYLHKITGMMILIYCAIGMRGNIFGAMGSRLGTAMHLGIFRMTFKKGSVLRSNIEASMALAMLLSLMMGVVGWAISVPLFGKSDPWTFIFISLVGGLLSSIIVVMFNIAIAHVGYKRNWDVDNITAPLIAAVGDIVTVPMIFLAAIMQENVGDAAKIGICIALSAIAVLFAAVILLRKTRRRKKDEAKRIILQSLPVLSVCMFLEIGAGIIVERATGLVTGHAVLLVLLPAFLNEGNALSGMLTSRLSSMLHLGTMEAKGVPRKEAFENFSMIYVVAAITFFVIGAASFLVSHDSLSFGTVIAVVMVAGLLSTTVLNFLSYYVAIAAAKFNLDPDDHCIPVTSSLMDVIGSGILVATVSLLVI